MNGARALPWVNTSRSPNSARIVTIGIIHQSFRRHRYVRSSPTMLTRWRAVRIAFIQRSFLVAALICPCIYRFSERRCAEQVVGEHTSHDSRTPFVEMHIVVKGGRALRDHGSEVIAFEALL